MKAGRWLVDDYELRRKPGTSGVFVVASRLVFRTGDGLRITVLPGWATDGASVPAALRWWAPPFAGPYTAAAILHDALYRAQPPGIDRATADRILLDAMLASDVRRTQAWAIYVGVRIGGWLPWRRNRRHVEDYLPFLVIEDASV